MSSFSRRHGYFGRAKEITVREEAPENLRYVVLQTARDLEWGPSSLRSIICPVLRIPPDASNWSEYPNIDQEVRWLMDECPWFKVYDIIEAIYRAMVKHDQRRFNDPGDAGNFTKALNDFFVEEGIGWQLIDGQIVARGDEGFQEAVKIAATQLVENERPTAASHIGFAVKALSERPGPNTPGAVAHATSAVECVLNDITGEVMTLGKYLDKHPGLFHPALKKSLDGLYGYASDAGARHGKEGKEPTFAEAQFAVTTCAAACSLLTAANPKSR